MLDKVVNEGLGLCLSNVTAIVEQKMDSFNRYSSLLKKI